MKRRSMMVILSMLFVTMTVYAINEQTVLSVRFGAAEDYLGSSVDISEDGSVAVVGGPGADIAGRADQGAIYIYYKDGKEWEQEFMLYSDDGNANDLLGTEVAISRDGDIAIAGSPGSQEERGAVYVFEKVGTDWSQVAKLTFNEGVGHESLGESVSISDDGMTIVAGMPDYDIETDDVGALLVYEMPAAGWSDTSEADAILTASDAERFTRLGSTVEISGDASVIVSGNPNKETCYIYQKPSGGWDSTTEERDGRINASDGGYYLEFGTSVSLNSDGSVIVVGSPGAFDRGWYRGVAYVFEYTGSYWAQSAILEPDAPSYSSTIGHGIDVNDDGDVIIVGASGDGDGGGVLYYQKDGDYWQSKYEDYFLITADRAVGDQLGKSVAISDTGDYIIAGAPTHDVGLNADQGQAYMYMASDFTE